MQPFLPTIAFAGVLAFMCGALTMTMAFGLPEFTLVVMLIGLLATVATNYFGQKQNPIFAS